MIGRKLDPLQKWIWRGSALMGAVFFVAFGIAAAFGATHGLGWEATVGFGVGSLFGLAWLLGCVRILRKGKLDLVRDNTWQAGWAWGITLILFVLFSMAAPKLPGNAGVLMLVTSVAYLVVGLGFLLRNVIEQNSLKNREQMLKLELRIAELARLVEEERATRA